MLHFVPLVPWPEYFMRYETTILMDIYHTLHPKGGFEVVFIGVEVDSADANSNPHTLEECFEDKLSIMPWTAIPFSGIKFRTYWEKLFPLSGYLASYSPTSFVIDPNGMVLQCNVNDLFYWYGTRAYPFTDERLECISREDARARKHPFITKLLASSECTHLINNNNQVFICSSICFLCLPFDMSVILYFKSIDVKFVSLPQHFDISIIMYFSLLNK